MDKSMKDDPRRHPFRDSQQDAAAADRIPDTAQTRASAYRLAFTDMDFLTREELRPVRLQLELLKPQMMLDERCIVSTLVLFGGARIPEPSRKHLAKTAALADLSNYYDEARRFAHKMTARSLESYGRENVIITGGGPGVMEAGNRGAHEAGGYSIGLNIVLPHEQAPNPWVTPELCFQFHYFALRKMHLTTRAKALVVFPGGFGTFDELFEILCLIQTGKSRPMPVLLFDRDYWHRVVNFTALAEEGVIDAADLGLFQFVETADEAWAIIEAHYAGPP